MCLPSRSVFHFLRSSSRSLIYRARPAFAIRATTSYADRTRDTRLTDGTFLFAKTDRDKQTERKRQRKKKGKERKTVSFDTLVSAKRDVVSVASTRARARARLLIVGAFNA